MSEKEFSLYSRGWEYIWEAFLEQNGKDADYTISLLPENPPSEDTA